MHIPALYPNYAIRPTSYGMYTLNSALFATGIVTVAYQFLFFLIAAYYKFDKLTDLAGGSNFVVLAIIGLALSDKENDSLTSRQLADSILVIIWGVRLSTFLFYRILLFNTDRRFDGTREDPIRFLVFWVFQMTWVYVVSLPVTVLNAISHNHSADASAKDYIGIIMAIIGFLLETWADYVKLQFKLQDTGEKWCDVGPWRYSRHPNYFGELLFWWGIFISCSSCFTKFYFLTSISPIFITFLLLGFSGMPLLEKQANLRYRSYQGYLEYRQETSPLLPLPRNLYASLPLVIKQVFLLEWPIYGEGLKLLESEQTNMTGASI